MPKEPRSAVRPFFSALGMRTLSVEPVSNGPPITGLFSPVRLILCHKLLISKHSLNPDRGLAFSRCSFDEKAMLPGTTERSRFMFLYFLALLIGVLAGLRAAVAPAVVSWAAHLGWLPLATTWAAFMGHWIAVAILSLAAIAELIADQLPNTPSRKVPQQFGARVISGAFCGAIIGTVGGVLVGGLIAGAIGAVIGTLAGYEARTRLVEYGSKDLSIALLEDAIAIVGGFLVVSSVA
jgi:uncharacterized membrane protein